MLAMAVKRRADWPLVDSQFLHHLNEKQWTRFRRGHIGKAKTTGLRLPGLCTASSPKEVISSEPAINSAAKQSLATTPPVDNCSTLSRGMIGDFAKCRCTPTGKHR
jgi:hypothetical protein